MISIFQANSGNGEGGTRGVQHGRLFTKTVGQMYYSHRFKVPSHHLGHILSQYGEHTFHNFESSPIFSRDLNLNMRDAYTAMVDLVSRGHNTVRSEFGKLTNEQDMDVFNILQSCARSCTNEELIWYEPDEDQLGYAPRPVRVSSRRRRSRSPEYLPRSPEYRPRSPEYRSLSPEVRVPSPEYRPRSPEYRPLSPEYRPLSPEVRVPSPEYIPQSPGYSPRSPSFVPQTPPSQLPANLERPELRRETRGDYIGEQEEEPAEQQAEPAEQQAEPAEQQAEEPAEQPEVGPKPGKREVRYDSSEDEDESQEEYDSDEDLVSSGSGSEDEVSSGSEYTEGSSEESDSDSDDDVPVVRKGKGKKRKTLSSNSPPSPEPKKQKLTFHAFMMEKSKELQAKYPSESRVEIAKRVGKMWAARDRPTVPPATSSSSSSSSSSALDPTLEMFANDLDARNKQLSYRVSMGSPNFGENVRRLMRENGFVVITNVLTASQVEQGSRLFRTWFNSDPQIARLHMPCSKHGIIKQFNISGSAFCWYTRTINNVVDVNRALHNRSDSYPMACSFDGACFISEDCAKKDGKPWIHADQSPNRKHKGRVISNDRAFSFQSYVSYTDNYADGRTTVFYKGSNNMFGRYFQQHPVEGDSRFKNWQRIDKTWMENNSHLRVTVAVPKGAMVAWDSRTFHSNQFGTRRHERLVGYSNMVPRQSCSAFKVRKRREYALEGVTTNHWVYVGARKNPPQGHFHTRQQRQDHHIDYTRIPRSKFSRFDVERAGHVRASTLL